MPYIYSLVRELENADKVGDGNCVALVQHFTDVGNTSTWRTGERVMDVRTILRERLSPHSTRKDATRTRPMAIMQLCLFGSDRSVQRQANPPISS